jgi:flagellar basal-body rod protein FlgB
MTVSDLPIFSMLRSRMQWHQERQKVLADNVANADTPKFRPRDLKPLEFGSQVAQVAQVRVVSTNPAHIGGSSETGAFDSAQNNKYDVRPAGNAVSLEEEMIKVAANQMDYQAATSLYSRSMGLFRIAHGKR